MSTKILSSDIELRLSERMTDADDGGGEMATGLVSNNAINQVFVPISNSDRVAGRVSLRQLYPHVNTTTADTYLGANVILATPPTDPTVEMLLFDSNIYAASRLEAKGYVESGVAIGPRSRMHPIGTQAQGQTQILAYQPLNKPLPQVGEVYILSVESTGVTQAFKITAVTASSETFSYASGTGFADLNVTQVVMTISQPLSSSFPGADPSPSYPGGSWIRRSNYSSSANYYGVSSLATTANIGALTVNVSSIQKQLVPAVTSQTVVANAQVGNSTTNISAGSHNIDVSNTAHNVSQAISISNVGTNFVKTLVPAPAAGSLVFSYRSGGIWYDLYDNGSGNLAGDSTAYGSGTINYTTGSCVISLYTPPDIGSSVFWSWGTPIHYQISTTGGATAPSMFIRFGTNQAPEEIAPGSLTVTYLKNTATIVATSNAAGVISNGDVTGYVDQRIGSVNLVWINIPDASSNIIINYNHATNFVENLHQAGWINSTASLSITLAHTNITPGTVLLSWQSKARYGSGTYHIPSSACS